MAFISRLEGAVLGLNGVDQSMVEIPSTSVLNNFETSNEITHYNVQVGEDGDAALLQQGDFMAPVINGTPILGTYVGTGVIENAGLTLGNMNDTIVGSLLALGIRVSVNPINVD